MIVETMSYEEIAREYDKIHDSIFPRSKERIDCQGMRRYLLKHKNEENVWFKQLDYKVDHNTTFCILPFTPGWKAFQRYGCHPYVKVYLIYLTSKGYMLLVRGGEKDDEYAFFTSHLFDRYRERELRDLSMDKREVIKEFFKHNGDICSVPFPIEKYPDNQLGITGKGVIFIQKITDKIWLNKTYIRRDQLQEGQFEAAMCTEEGMAYALEQRKRIQELLLKYPYQHMHINYF